MTGIIIFSLLCLAAASVVLRVILFMSGRRDDRRLAKIASIAGSIGFAPLIAFKWASDLLMIGLLIFILALLIR
jgi:hypothetical protein